MMRMTEETLAKGLVIKGGDYLLNNVDKIVDLFVKELASSFKLIFTDECEPYSVVTYVSGLDGEELEPITSTVREETIRREVVGSANYLINNADTIAQLFSNDKSVEIELLAGADADILEFRLNEVVMIDCLSA